MALQSPTVRDHLSAGPPLPEWVHQLGECIQRLEGGPAAISASRARDLYHCEPVARVLEQLLRAGETLADLPPGSLSQLQRQTLRHLLQEFLQSMLSMLEEDIHEL